MKKFLIVLLCILVIAGIAVGIIVYNTNQTEPSIALKESVCSNSWFISKVGDTIRIPGNHWVSSTSCVRGKIFFTHPSSISTTYCLRYPYLGKNKRWELYRIISYLLHDNASRRYGQAIMPVLLLSLPSNR